MAAAMGKNVKGIMGNYYSFVPRPKHASMGSIGRLLVPRHAAKYHNKALQIRQSVEFSQAVQRSGYHFVKEDYPIGRTLHGYSVEKVTSIPELSLTAVQLLHIKTGAAHLHLAREDENNVFCVGFRTTPMDSTGVSHILEHTTLCGSQKFPCKDPFFKMLNRSLATFMNALTASDFTMYPFSTQNPKDFENLLMVYLDSVLYPLLRKPDFLQEGWRLEHLSVNDRQSPVIIKGVVFNEMKGAMANSERLFTQSLQNHILPSHTYSYISGGDPLCIPNLSWDELRHFHRTHYHPSNAWFYTYGNFPLENHLQTINEMLNGFERITCNTVVLDEVPWKHAREAAIVCCHDPLAPHPDRQTTVAVSYLCNRITDVQESFTLHVLSQLLLDGPNAPFYKTLLEPNIGSGYSPGSGYNNETKQAVFSVGLRGIHPEQTRNVVKIIDQTISDVIRDGFTDERIEAILHGIELGLKHQTANFGLALIMSLSAPWNHGADPADALQINQMVQSFRERLKSEPRYLQRKLKEYVQDNPHRLSLVMNASTEYSSDRDAAESKLLQSRLDTLSSENLEIIYQQGLELNRQQSRDTDDLSCLPTLTVADIAPYSTPTILEQTEIGHVPVQLSRQPTNGLLYFRGVLNSRHLPSELKPLLPIFCNVVTKMAAGKFSFKQFAHEIDLKTGGLDVSPIVTEDLLRSFFYEEGISLYSHCLERNADDMLMLWEQLFNGVDFSDVGRLFTLVNDVATEMATGITESGHRYAMIRAASNVDPRAALSEKFYGLEQINVLKNTVQNEDLGPLVRQLQTIASCLLNKDHLRLSVNATEEFMPKACDILRKFISVIPGAPSGQSNLKSNDETFVRKNCKQHVVLPYPVNFVSRCLPTVTFCHEDFASLRILARLLTAKFLHREIREKGGAYGGGATTNISGTFAFYSYRDPRSFETLDAFDAAVDWARKGSFKEQDINEAKLSVFSEVDAPIAPGAKGGMHFLQGLSDEIKQTHREQLLKTTAKHIVENAQKYLCESQCCSEVIIGPETVQNPGTQWETLNANFL